MNITIQIETGNEAMETYEDLAAALARTFANAAPVAIEAGQGAVWDANGNRVGLWTAEEVASETEDWLISRPRSNGAQVTYSTRMVITDVPVGTDVEAVRDWLGGEYSPRDDYVGRMSKARPNEQLTAEGAQRVRWTA